MLCWFLIPKSRNISIVRQGRFEMFWVLLTNDFVQHFLISDMSSCWDQMVHWKHVNLERYLPKTSQKPSNYSFTLAASIFAEAWVKNEPSIKEKEFTPTRLYVPKGLKSICDLWWTTTWSRVDNMQHSKRSLDQRDLQKFKFKTTEYLNRIDSSSIGWSKWSVKQHLLWKSSTCS